MAKNFLAARDVAIVAFGETKIERAAELVRIIANLVNVAPAALKIGLRVKVRFEPIAPDMNYFAFEPAE